MPSNAAVICASYSAREQSTSARHAAMFKPCGRSEASGSRRSEPIARSARVRHAAGSFATHPLMTVPSSSYSAERGAAAPIAALVGKCPSSRTRLERIEPECCALSVAALPQPFHRHGIIKRTGRFGVGKHRLRLRRLRSSREGRGGQQHGHKHRADDRRAIADRLRRRGAHFHLPPLRNDRRARAVAACAAVNAAMRRGLAPSRRNVASGMTIGSEQFRITCGRSNWSARPPPEASGQASVGTGPSSAWPAMDSCTPSRPHFRAGPRSHSSR